MSSFKKYAWKNEKKTKTEIPSFTLSESYKSDVCEKAYLGRRGYTIPKSILSEQDLNFLKEDLFLKAKPGINMGAPTDIVSFPVYRESPNKLYIPRFYGEKRYGKPHKSEISNGEPCDLQFTKTLRDYQTEIIDVYLNHVSKDDSIGGGGILEVGCGKGKTVMALNIISKIQKKTLILVHKEFLMNQWIERIGEFLPSARIGKIQGPKFEIDDRDIVLGMIQTMYSRDFPTGSFDSFGLTIIDEVHRIGSEEFSKTLLKTVTPYMLGISATVDRKDGLTSVLHMFIGDKIYHDDSEKEDPVIVRGIQFQHTDSDFIQMEYDFRGNPKYSTMISKLCDFNPRKNFIVKVTHDLLLENNEKQIMILAHNRSLLTYLHDSIKHKEIGTVGYYVGGMKEKDLKETEEKQIVLATYAMAAEALDIKTLSTLIMATPKTDIEQSVGRILRSKHENPIVVDIIDLHDTFQNQWKTRKRFYKKCNYKIIHNTSGKYVNMENCNEWKVDFDPNASSCAKKQTKKDPKDGGVCMIQLSEEEQTQELISYI